MNMSASKYSKHQKSSKPRYVVSDEKGKVLFTAMNEKEFLESRNDFIKSKQKLVTNK